MLDWLAIPTAVKGVLLGLLAIVLLPLSVKNGRNRALAKLNSFEWVAATKEQRRRDAKRELGLFLLAAVVVIWPVVTSK